MNDDGIPELAVTTVIFQERDPETLEQGSTFFDSTIFSYKDGEVFIWGGGDQRHNPFEILSNKALLYDFDDGHGGREIIYHELDGITCESFLVWITSPDRSSAEQGIFFIEYGLKDGVFSEIQHPVSVPDDI